MSGSLLLALTGAALALCAWLITRLVLPLLERHAHHSGLVDAPAGRKDHARPTPLVGGIALVLGVAVPALAGLLAALVAAGPGGMLPEAIAVHLPGIRSRAPELLAILLGCGVMLLLGHLDDRRGLSAWARLLVELACAWILAAAGVRITLFLPDPWMHTAVTVLFVVFVTNAVNFLDNMNGLMGGVVLAGCLHLLTLAISSGQLFMAAILACLAGALLAFLGRNFPVARVFSGDAGSLSVGFLLASLAVLFTYQEGGVSVRPVLVPLAILAVPLVDACTVVMSRLLHGVHPFTAGHDHLSHRLVRRGLPAPRAVLLLWSAQVLAGVPALVLCGARPLAVAAVWIPALAILALRVRRAWMLPA